MGELRGLPDRGRLRARVRPDGGALRVANAERSVLATSATFDAAVDADGQWYILGRSDDTIKVAGKRLGPAEVETVLVSDPAVVEAGAIGVPDELKGQALVVFCVLAPGFEATNELAAALREKITGAMGKPLTPKAVCFVPDLPKTRNAKVMRRVLRAAYLGEPAGDLSALVNPEIVDAIRQTSSALP